MMIRDLGYQDIRYTCYKSLLVTFTDMIISFRLAISMNFETIFYSVEDSFFIFWENYGSYWKGTSKTLNSNTHVCLFVGFYGISTFVGYLMPNPFSCKVCVPLKTIQFSISTQFNGQKHFHFKLFKQLYVIIQLCANTVLMSKNSSISDNSVKHKHTVSM